MVNASRIPGKANITSNDRMITSSPKDPKYPAMRPRIVPTDAATPTAKKPT
jgi:hypothetical protein